MSASFLNTLETLEHNIRLLGLRWQGGLPLVVTEQILSLQKVIDPCIWDESSSQKKALRQKSCCKLEQASFVLCYILK